MHHHPHSHTFSFRSFAAARRALRHRVEDHQHLVIKTRENEFTDSHLGALFDETVRLSGVSGPPTLNTPFDKMKEVTVYNEKVKSGIIDETGGLEHDVIVATRRGWMTGSLTIPQKVRGGGAHYIINSFLQNKTQNTKIHKQKLFVLIKTKAKPSLG